MTKLTVNDFEAPDSPVQAGPFAVTILHDPHPEHPADNDEGFPPVLHTFSDGDGISRTGGVEVSFFSTVSPAWVSRHWRALCRIFDIAEADHDADARRDAGEWRIPLSDARHDLFAAALCDVAASDLLDTLAELYTLAGVPAYSLARNGYTQGQYLNMLIVFTPDWCRLTGFDSKRQDAEADANSAADQLAAWAFGDCYGYSIEGPVGETVDSCFGYLGAWWSDRGDIPHMFDCINEALEAATADHDLAGLAMQPEAVQIAAPA